MNILYPWNEVDNEITLNVVLLVENCAIWIAIDKYILILIISYQTHLNFTSITSAKLGLESSLSDFIMTFS